MKTTKLLINRDGMEFVNTKQLFHVLNMENNLWLDWFFLLPENNDDHNGKVRLEIGTAPNHTGFIKEISDVFLEINYAINISGEAKDNHSKIIHDYLKSILDND